MSQESFQAPDLDHLAELLPSLDFQAFIAQGGMGAVYRARQRSLDRDVAVKILPRELGADPQFHTSFETEAKAMARLNHPNLISVYDFGDVDGMPYIVMEYVDGKSLYHSAWNKQIEPKQAVEIVAGICRGLAHAHESGVIHRDIKPANILLTPKAEPKIGDFGLARPADYDGPGLNMGTPGYSAPEVIANPEMGDARSDLFAVGVILHELVTGQPPDPDASSQKKPTGNLRLDAIWRKATQADPNRRYASAAEMAAALEGWLINPGPNTAGPPPGGPKPGPAPAPAPGHPPTPTPVKAPAAPASNWSLVRNLLIVAALFIGIAFAYKAYDRRKSDVDEQQARLARESYEKRRQAELEAQRQAEREAEQARLAAERPEPQPEPEDQPKEESPLETLERLRQDLAAGGRDEMPKGTVRQGDRDFLVVEKPLGWHQAAAFAEAHGGHLAIVTSDDDITWFAEILPRDTTVWLGTGRAQGDKWVNLDGSPWALERNPPGAGAYATLDDLGLLRTHRRTDRLPFIIQWRRDGSNPATLGAMLARTRASLESPSPVFPPGTESQDARYFAIVPREMDRHTAARLAEQAGGTLAVPNTPAEADWIESRIAELDAPAGFWLGATRSGSGWKWDTGESWDLTRWAPDSPPDTGPDALVIVPGEGWRATPADEPASGFIIEWSADAEGTAVSADAMGESDGALGELQTKARQLLAQAAEERDAKLAANARTFNWDLDVWLRGLKQSDRDLWGPQVEELKRLVRRNRVPSPDSFGGEDSVRLSEQMEKVCAYSHDKQREIDEGHLAKVGRIRDAYVGRLRDAAAEAADDNRTSLLNQLREAARQAEDLEAWVESMTR